MKKRPDEIARMRAIVARALRVGSAAQLELMRAKLRCIVDPKQTLNQAIDQQLPGNPLMREYRRVAGESIDLITQRLEGIA